MIREAVHFREECTALASVLDGLNDADFQQKTQFMDWTIEDVIGHLHVWNFAAGKTLDSRDAFGAFFQFIMQHFGDDGTSLPSQNAWLDTFADGIRGKALFNAWRQGCDELATAYESADPNQRVAWAGPDMSAQSKIIARQMETWAHGQEIFDVLGLDRQDGDRIRNIAHLGVTTYSWTFRNRSEEPPTPKPFVKLTAPSGEIWEWNDPQDDNAVIGNAVEFCQIVTQTRNVKDTSIECKGEHAVRWMSIAQCFAGMAKDPPAKGVRHKAKF